MEAILKLNKWANADTNIGLDALRFLFGGFLIYKGYFLIGSNSDEMSRILEVVPQMENPLTLLRYMAMEHTCAGIFIILGFLTRPAVLIQIPIIIGALIVNCIGEMDLPGLTAASLCL